MDERERIRYKAYIKAKSLKTEINKLQQKINKLKIELSQAQNEFNEIDRELMMEKKTIISLKKAPKERVKKDKDFTMDEVLSIAKKLGIEIRR